MSGKTRAGRVSRDDWLKAALDVLAKEGVKGIKIDGLARRVGVAKTGFYWHFRNREDLLDAILGFWEREYTNVVAGNPKVAALPPAERLDTIAALVAEHNLARYDLAIASWARHDDRANKLLEKTYQVRRRYVRQAFWELGFRGDDLEMRTRLFVCYVSNESVMFGDTLTAADKRRRRLRTRLLVQTLET